MVTFEPKGKVLFMGLLKKINTKAKAGSQYVSKLKASLLAKWDSEEKKTEKAKKVLKPRIKAEKVAEE